jgi:hypothetical protein
MRICKLNSTSRFIALCRKRGTWRPLGAPILERIMKIIASDITLSSQRFAASTETSQQNVRAWVGAERPDFEGRGRRAIPAAQVQISDAAKALQASDVGSTAPVDAAEETESDPFVLLIKGLVESLMGRPIRLFHASELRGGESASVPASPAESAPAAPPARRQGWGLEVQAHYEATEVEQTSFQASGVIRTADNKEISFDFSMTLKRQYHEESDVAIYKGDAKKVDPLVVNFSGGAAQLSSKKFEFDLNADGKTESISFVRGAGFLALDRNGDGKINDGSELFGTASGNGFADLSVLDSDGNGWIDESDPAFAQLKVWTKDDAGKDQMQSMKQANVGALFLGNASTEFSINNAQNQTQAQLRSSGIWLSEDGKVGSLQQIDLVA